MCHIEVKVTATNGQFSASHDGVMVDTSEPVMNRFTDFEQLKVQEMEFHLSEGGWLRLERDDRGYLSVRFHIRSHRAATFLETQFYVEGEFADGFCRELRLLFSH